MIQKLFLFSNNQKSYIKEKDDKSEYIPIIINDQIENILDDKNDSFLLNDELEPFYNFNINIERYNKNNSVIINNNRFINPFPEINRDLDKIEICNKEFRKLEDAKKNIIFEIMKDHKRRNDIQIKGQRNKIEHIGSKINKDNKCFPFKDSKRLFSIFDFKFYTKKYFIKENGKIKKMPKRRKFKSDDIRKKIKSRFHKELKNILNKNLKNCGSKKLFDCLPQCFISNVSKTSNSEYLNLTYKELLSIDFQQKLNKENCML